MATGIRRDEKDVDFLVLCQNKQNMKVLTNSVTMLCTMFKWLQRKIQRFRKKKPFLHMVHVLNFGPKYGHYSNHNILLFVIHTASAILFYMYIKINQ